MLAAARHEVGPIRRPVGAVARGSGRAPAHGICCSGRGGGTCVRVRAWVRVGFREVPLAMGHAARVRWWLGGRIDSVDVTRCGGARTCDGVVRVRGLAGSSACARTTAREMRRRPRQLGSHTDHRIRLTDKMFFLVRLKRGGVKAIGRMASGLYKEYFSSILGKCGLVPEYVFFRRHINMD